MSSRRRRSSIAIRAYAIVFGFMILMAEVNWPRLFLEYFRFLDVWAIKGLFACSWPCATIDTKVSNDYGTLQLATALAVGLLGFIYLCLGLMCVKPVETCARRRSRKKEKDGRPRRLRASARTRPSLHASPTTRAGPRPRFNPTLLAEPRAADVARRGERLHRGVK